MHNYLTISFIRITKSKIFQPLETKKEASEYFDLLFKVLNNYDLPPDDDEVNN